MNVNIQKKGKFDDLPVYVCYEDSQIFTKFTRGLIEELKIRPVEATWGINFRIVDGKMVEGVSSLVIDKMKRGFADNEETLTYKDAKRILFTKRKILATGFLGAIKKDERHHFAMVDPVYVRSVYPGYIEVRAKDQVSFCESEVEGDNCVKAMLVNICRLRRIQ